MSVSVGCFVANQNLLSLVARDREDIREQVKRNKWKRVRKERKTFAEVSVVSLESTFPTVDILEPKMARNSLPGPGQVWRHWEECHHNLHSVEFSTRKAQV